jgi:hypothetical protein
MVHPFKIRNGVRTCAPCGKTKQDIASRPAQGTIAARASGCSSAECPWQNEQHASPEELQAKYGYLMLWSH